MIPPEDNIKGQIRSVLHLHGISVTSTLDEIAKDIYGVLFNELNMASIKFILREIEEQETDD